MVAVPGRRWGHTPKVLTLLDAAAAHLGAFEFDWRSRFGLRFDPGGTTSWGETVRLFEQLKLDPASHVFAALAGWEYPLSRQAIATTFLLEVTMRVHHDKKKGRFQGPQYPWPDQSKDRRVYGRTTRSPQEIRAALAARGHGALLALIDGQPVTRTSDQPRDERGRFAKRR